jgi:hypothetical protein
MGFSATAVLYIVKYIIKKAAKQVTAELKYMAQAWAGGGQHHSSVLEKSGLA